MDLWAAVDQGDTRAGPEQFQRSDGGRVLRADHHHIVIVVRMRLLVVVNHFVQLFAGHVEHVRHVVVAGGEDDFLRACNGARCDGV